jgi:hypothetical protein
LVNVQCGLINKQLIGPFILVGCLTADYYLQNQLPRLKDVPLHARLNMWLQHDSHSGLQVVQYLNRCYGNCWNGHGGPHVWPPLCQIWHPLISTCGDTWSTGCIMRNHRHEINSYSAQRTNMKTSRK